jgi:hypothetical protein
MEKFSMVNTALISNVSNDTAGEQSESTFKDFEHGGNDIYGFCVIA